jgi:hypothetical protein
METKSVVTLLPVILSLSFFSCVKYEDPPSNAADAPDSDEIP